MALPAGIPALLSQFAAAFGLPPALLTADSYFGYGPYLPPQWGLYLDGAPAIIADSVRSFGYRQDWNISTYPVEGGGFESYNKVNSPYLLQIEFVTGGTEADRADLLSTLEMASDSLDLYDLVTPETIYVGVSVQHASLSRRALRGANMIAVDVWVQEIREQNGGDIAYALDPSGQSVIQRGNVQLYDAPTSVGSQISAVT